MKSLFLGVIIGRPRKSLRGGLRRRLIGRLAGPEHAADVVQLVRDRLSGV
jgi:hypothetical protein